VWAGTRLMPALATAEILSAGRIVLEPGLELISRMRERCWQKSLPLPKENKPTNRNEATRLFGQPDRPLVLHCVSRRACDLHAWSLRTQSRTLCLGFVLPQAHSLFQTREVPTWKSCGSQNAATRFSQTRGLPFLQGQHWQRDRRHRPGWLSFHPD